MERLQGDYRVISIDLRGHGESDRYTDTARFTTEKIIQDIHAVADECAVDRFVVWGFSYGANIGKYLAAASDRVVGAVLMGAGFGRGAEGGFRELVTSMEAHWVPILNARRDGTLDPETLDERDRQFLAMDAVNFEFLAWIKAILDWPRLIPADMPVPVLLLVGTNDPEPMALLAEYEAQIAGSTVRLERLEGLDHPGTHSEIETVLPVMREFTNSLWAVPGQK